MTKSPVKTCLSTNRPTPSYIGESFFETDTKNIIVFGSGGWITYGTPPPFSNEASILLDGTNEFVTIDGGAITLGTSDLALSIWFKHLTNTPGYLCVGDSLSGTMYLDDFSGSPALLVRGVWGSATITTGITTGSWQHVFLTRDGGTQKIYLDGSLKYTSTNSTSFTIARFGAYTSNGNSSLDGNIDEIALWDSGQDSNAAAIYNSGTPTDVSNLLPKLWGRNPTHWWRMGDINGSSGTTIADQGSGSVNCETINGPVYSTDTP